MVTANANNPISERQTAFIAQLMREREWTDVTQPTNAAEASTLIGQLLKLPKKAAAPKVANVPELIDGMYSDPNDGTIYKLQYNRASGDGRRLYGKRLVLETRDTDYHVRFEYVPGITRVVNPAWRMTLAEAKAFGALYGQCCVCGRTLTDEISIANGIGPVCAGRFDR